MAEMDYTTQAAQAKLSANAARAAEARMRSEGTDVASPEGMEMENMEMEDAEEADGAPKDDLPNASLESVPDISPEEEAALHGADAAPAATSKKGKKASSKGDALDVDSADGTEVHDAGVKTS